MEPEDARPSGPILGGGAMGLWGDMGRYPDFRDFEGDAPELFGKSLHIFGSVSNFARDGVELLDPEHNYDILMSYARAIDCFLQQHGVMWCLKSKGVEVLAQAIGALETYDEHKNDWRIGRRYYDGTSLGSKRGRANVAEAAKKLKDTSQTIKNLEDQDQPASAPSKTHAARKDKAGGAAN